MASPAPSLRLLGPMTVARGDEPVPLPRSQKTRALLAYIAVTQRPHLRERLCRMFWDVTDDPRGSLRWSLSKLRVLDDEDTVRIVADRQSVAFQPANAHVDAVEVRVATARALDGLSVERLNELVAMFRGPFLEGLELPDFEEFQAWRAAERERFRELHLRLLRELVPRLSASPEDAVPHARELVRAAPDDQSARATLIRLLAACGRREEAEEHYDLGRRQIEKSGAIPTELRDAWREVVAAPLRPPPRTEPQTTIQQEVRMCTAPDGVRIAFATVGNGLPLVKTANWLSHLEHDWKSPLWRRMASELSRDFRLVRYDARGTGLSDWTVEDLSLEASLRDLETVVDTLGLERFALLGISQGSRVAVAYAAKHPERVTRLVLYGASARGWKLRDATSRDRRAGLQPLIRQGWGTDMPAFRQVFTTLFMPGATPEQVTWFNELQRVSTSPENAFRITEAFGEIDITDQLTRVRAPTLIMHATQDAMVPFEEWRTLAAGIRHARFVPLESQNHILLEDEPAFARFMAETCRFLSSDPPW